VRNFMEWTFCFGERAGEARRRRGWRSSPRGLTSTARVPNEGGGVFQVPKEIARRRHFGVSSDAIDEFVDIGGEALGELRAVRAGRSPCPNPTVFVLREHPSKAQIEPQSVSGGRDQCVPHVDVVSPADPVEHQVQGPSADGLGDFIGDEVRSPRDRPHPGARPAARSRPAEVEGCAGFVFSKLALQPRTHQPREDACEQAEGGLERDSLRDRDEYGDVRREPEIKGSVGGAGREIDDHAFVFSIPKPRDQSAASGSGGVSGERPYAGEEDEVVVQGGGRGFGLLGPPGVSAKGDGDVQQGGERRSRPVRVDEADGAPAADQPGGQQRGEGRAADASAPRGDGPQVPRLDGLLGADFTEDTAALRRDHGGAKSTQQIFPINGESNKTSNSKGMAPRATPLCQHASDLVASRIRYRNEIC
jgi:hypothetical protein